MLLKDRIDHDTVVKMQQAAGLVPWFVAEGDTRGHEMVVMLPPEPKAHDVIALGGSFYQVRGITKRDLPEGRTLIGHSGGLRSVARLVRL